MDYNERMKKSRPKAETLNVGDYVSIKIDKVDKTPLHPNILIGEILAFENDYAKVACKFGIFPPSFHQLDWLNVKQQI